MRIRNIGYKLVSTLPDGRVDTIELDIELKKHERIENALNELKILVEANLQRQWELPPM